MSEIIMHCGTMDVQITVDWLEVVKDVLREGGDDNRDMAAKLKKYETDYVKVIILK